jgi:hypothetical protein
MIRFTLCYAEAPGKVPKAALHFDGQTHQLSRLSIKGVNLHAVLGRNPKFYMTGKARSIKIKNGKAVVS